MSKRKRRTHTIGVKRLHKPILGVTRKFGVYQMTSQGPAFGRFIRR